METRCRFQTASHLGLKVKALGSLLKGEDRSSWWTLSSFSCEGLSSHQPLRNALYPWSHDQRLPANRLCLYSLYSHTSSTASSCVDTRLQCSMLVSNGGTDGHVTPLISQRADRKLIRKSCRVVTPAEQRPRPRPHQQRPQP